ncbi:MAG: hypothetical protein Q8N47_23330 [Bryobacterales bacterium]|nr:hypothetical protein [Bryobacterales bacterium]
MIRFLLLAAAVACNAAAVDCSATADSADPTYGGRVRQLVKPDGHEHNLYYDRNVWNADNSYMLGVYSDLDQRNWRVVLYNGDGCYIKDLFSIEEFDWRLTWDRKDPEILYTWSGSNLYRYNVTSGEAVRLKSFAPLTFKPAGPSLNQTGDRILMVTSDGAFHSFALPDMTDERAFKPEFPPGCEFASDKPRYIGYSNYIVAYCNSANTQAVDVYDDTGERLHRFENVGGGGHHDFSPNGKWVYFTLWGRDKPLEIHVVNIDGTDDRVLYSVPAEKLRNVQNLHLAWPARATDWFLASFFPPAASIPLQYSPMQDEIVLIKLDGTVKPLARSGTAVTRDLFWAQPLARPSADGSRASFNSNRSGSVDQFILYIDPQ